MGRKILGLLVSIVLIAGGASGQLVLRGTNSSMALVVAGVIFLIFDIYSIATHKESSEDIKNLQEEADAVNAAKYAGKYPGKKKRWSIFWWLLGDFGFLGLHSFYLGEKKVGLLKITVLLVSGILLGFGIKNINNGRGDALMILSCFGLTALFIWNIVDLVIICRLSKSAFEANTPDSTPHEPT
jgi:hypothetical protein